MVPGVQSRFGSTHVAVRNRHEKSTIKASPNEPSEAACKRYRLADRETKAAANAMARSCRRANATTMAANQGTAIVKSVIHPEASINRLPGRRGYATRER